MWQLAKEGAQNSSGPYMMLLSIMNPKNVTKYL